MASLPLEFHPEARLETFEAFDWYAARSMEAAHAFQQELADAGRAIQSHPELWASYLFGTRRYLLKRFPFVLVYRVTPARIEIVAVAHGRRNPGYWRRRVSS
ncbi:MAG: type II toxin-antitoxin system RelE/ParE family toxin [Pirellulaceae bacterium]